MSRFTSIEITIDCNDLNAMFDFWQKALQYIPEVSDLERYDKNERKYLSLVDPNKKFVKIILQKVDEIKTIKNRIHLDLHCDDIEKEVARLETLGARRIDTEPINEQGTSWIRMTDIEDNEFCVVLSN
ncbi:MAG: VOC family protein [Candidatus Nanopelagicales bacterium]